MVALTYPAADLLFVFAPVEPKRASQEPVVSKPADWVCHRPPQELAFGSQVLFLPQRVAVQVPVMPPRGQRHPRHLRKPRPMVTMSWWLESSEAIQTVRIVQHPPEPAALTPPLRG